MVQANSPGRAQPRIKTIDVEANLLAERIGERERLLDALSKRALAGFLVLGFALVALPAAYKLQAKTVVKEAEAHVAATTAEKLLADKKAILTSAQPVVQETEMLSRVRSYATNTLAGIGGILNSSSDKMVLALMKVEILGGEMKVSLRADAESYPVARDFVAKLAKLPKAKQVTLKSWRQNEEFGPNAVSFEVQHSAGVGQ